MIRSLLKGRLFVRHFLILMFGSSFLSNYINTMQVLNCMAINGLLPEIKGLKLCYHTGPTGDLPYPLGLEGISRA